LPFGDGIIVSGLKGLAVGMLISAPTAIATARQQSDFVPGCGPGIGHPLYFAHRPKPRPLAFR